MFNTNKKHRSNKRGSLGLFDSELKVGNFRIPVKRLCIIAAFAALIGVIFAVNNVSSSSQKTEEEQQAEEAQYTLTPLSLSSLQGGSYYVKNGDSFYAVASGWLYSSKKDDTLIPKEASPTERVLLFGKDDTLIPTLYRGDSLIYKSVGGEAIPTDFYLERFKDEGYTIGIRGLADTNENGKYNTVVHNGTTFYPNSSLASLELSDGVSVTLDKINGKSLTSASVSTVGTVTGLTKGTSYKLDLYGGTVYVAAQAVADVHAMSSYELYDLKDYTMSQDNYVCITLPDYLWTGYYYVNGAGLFRYVNADKTANIQNLKYNVPYFLGTDNHNDQILNPANDGNEDAVYLGEHVDLSEFAKNELTDEQKTSDTDQDIDNDQDTDNSITETEESKTDVDNSENTEDEDVVEAEKDSARQYILCDGEEFDRTVDSLSSEVTDITFTNTKAPDNTPISDVSVDKDGSVAMWITDNSIFVSTQQSDQKIIANESCLNMFNSDEKLASVNMMYLDTSNIKNMSGMFYGDKTLSTVLNFSDVSSVEDMSSMFAGCISLNNYDFATSWDLNNVQNFTNMCLQAVSHPEFQNTTGTWDTDTGTFSRGH